MSDEEANIERWTGALRGFLPGFLAQSPALGPLAERSAALLHGSTAMGVDDPHSDLDLWLFADSENLRAAEAIAQTRFFSFDLDGKQGHLNLEDLAEAADRVSRCDMELITELRHARVLADPQGLAGELVERAARPMSEAVRRAWFCHHFVQLCQFCRGADNPIERGDRLAILQMLVPAINHALRAAMVLDREPYPYIKWLGQAAARTPTGGRITPLVQEVLDLLSADVLRQPGPESGRPLMVKLRDARQILVDCARAEGIDEPWMVRWWRYLPQAAEGVRSVAW